MNRKRAPRSPADPRPDNRPYFVDPNCSTCGTPLVLDGLLANPSLPADKVWYDEWICPNHVEEGIVMDWPQRMIERLRGRSFEMEMEPNKRIVLADIPFHPRALAELVAASGLTVDEIVAVLTGIDHED